MIPPPPRSTLFPYTTLFRSSPCPLPEGEGSHRVGAVGSHHTRRAMRTDRKSTRLNSSHVSISYAVFCLKKKKEAENFWNRQSRFHHLEHHNTEWIFMLGFVH